MRKIFILISIICSTQLYSQEDIDNLNDADEIIDNLLEEETLEEFIKTITNFQFIYFSVDYNNKTYFSGRDIGINQFNVTPQVSYMHSKGFFAGVSGIYYSEFVPQFDYVSLNLGYGKNFGKQKNYRWSTSYARYFYSTGVDNPFTNTLTATLGLKNKSKNFGGQISGTYLFGDENSFQFIASSYALINLYNAKKTSLKLRPQLNVLFGKHIVELSRNINIGGQIFTQYTQNNEAGLINTQINIPLQLNVDKYDFELGYTLNLPSALAGETNLNSNGTFNLSIAYMIDWD